MHPRRVMIDINKLRVAKPCSVGWETMTGDERARHCQSCKLYVYNIAGMTNAEVQHLVASREGRLCIRLFRRPDGTVITKDCPVGLRAYQKRIAKFAGASLATMLGLFSISFGQKDDKKGIDASKIKIERTIVEGANSRGKLSGTIFDEAGAVIPGVTIHLAEKNKKSFRAVSNGEGVYSFSDIPPTEKYKITLEAAGFISERMNDVMIGVNESLKMDVVLNAAGVTVGIIVEDPIVESKTASVTTTVTHRIMQRLPF
jgi:hypothetical protein